ncbi:MAG: lycopene cyclase domain-containing protein [Chloroflexota bacterium]
MTYFGFLLRFLIPPILALLIVTWLDGRAQRCMPGFDGKKVGWIIGAHVALALVYTTPWDNYLVATGVWYYNPALVTGMVLGYVPIEEYTFFVLETILAGLWWGFLARRIPTPVEFKPSKTGRVLSALALAAVWTWAAFVFFNGHPSMTYLSITLFWALPAIFPQLLFGADILWHHRRLVAAAILPLGLYLSLMDIVALKATTWSISPAQTTGVLFFGILPLEEVLFFFITNVLVGFGMTLMLSDLGMNRLAAWKSKKFRGLP